MKPIIFLDIDGVLHIAGDPALTLNPQCVAALNWLTDFGVQIVVSSTWRFFPDLKERLAKGGLTGKIIDTTPYVHGGNRGSEIQRWLRTHAKRPFVILDDETDMGTLTPHLIQTSFHEGGLTLPLAELALQHLTAHDSAHR